MHPEKVASPDILLQMAQSYYTRCVKNKIPDTFSNNFNKRGPMSIIFATENIQKVSNLFFFGGGVKIARLDTTG